MTDSLTTGLSSLHHLAMTPSQALLVLLLVSAQSLPAPESTTWWRYYPVQEQSSESNVRAEQSTESNERATLLRTTPAKGNSQPTTTIAENEPTRVNSSTTMKAITSTTYTSTTSTTTTATTSTTPTTTQLVESRRFPHH